MVIHGLFLYPMEIRLPSPVEQIHLPLFNEKGLEVFVKRDDLIHPLVSGNKWRKLKYLLTKAVKERKNHLVTFGGAFSNHLLATAVAAKAGGLKASAFVRGEKVLNPVLQACRDFGMTLHFTDRLSYRDKKALFSEYFGSDQTAFFIDEGGASAEAVEGCAELIAELPHAFDHIFCAAGTGTTAAGIYKGIQAKGLHTRLHIVPALKDGLFLQSVIAEYVDLEEDLVLHPDFHFGGYAKASTELLQFVIDWHRDTGILIEPVYTGKLLYGLIQLIQQDHFKKGDQILWVHTGGLTGLEGFRNQFDRLAPGFTQNFIPLRAK